MILTNIKTGVYKNRHVSLLITLSMYIFVELVLKICGTFFMIKVKTQFDAQKLPTRVFGRSSLSVD